MNVYQKVILSTVKISVDVKDAKITVTDDSIVLKQSENAYIEKYDVVVTSACVSSVELDKKPVLNQDGKVCFSLDFTSRTSQVVFNFVDKLAEPLCLTVVYEESSKEAWDEKKRQEHLAQLIRNARISVATGVDLVNIYFQPCCEEYTRTEIVLYRHSMMLAKYKVDEETFFKSISGLAFSSYEFVLKQFDKDGNLLFETNRQSFEISPQGSDRPMGRINRI